MIAEIIGPSGKVHYRRPKDDPMIEEARRTPGYSIRMICTQDDQPCHLPECSEHGCMSRPQ